MSKKQSNPALLAAITASLNTGSVITSTGDVFNDNLPEGLTKEQGEKFVAYTGEFITTGYEALGLGAVKALAADDKLTEVTGNIALGSQGFLDTTTIRSKESKLPGAEEPTITYGGTRAKVTFAPGSEKSDFAAPKATIKAAAKAALAK